MSKIVSFLIPFLLMGCDNPYNQFYTDFTGGKNVLENPDVVTPTGEPKLIQGSNIEKDTKQMMEDGYSLLGASSFNASDIDQKLVLEQAKKIHADTVIVYTKYTNTISGSMPLTLPNTQTSYHSGMISGYGGSASYFGSSTTYGSTTTYMPYNIRRYDYYASFWVKQKPAGLGIYYDDLTDELRREIGSNKGIRIAIVEKGSPAFDNDLLVGDVIRKFNDIEVVDKFHYQNITKENREPQIKLEILRGGKNITKQIQLNTARKTQEQKQQESPSLLQYSPPKSQKDVQVSTEKESTIDKTSRKEGANGSSEPREEPQFVGVCAQCGRHIGKNEKICMSGSKLLCTECFKKTSENR